MRKWIVSIIVLLAGSAPLHAEIAHIDGAGLQRLLWEGVPIVDVRTPAEWDRTGVIEGSHLLTFFDAEGRYDAGAWAAELALIAGPDRPVALICHGGTRSGKVSRLLDRHLEYRHVYNVRGGIAQWLAEGRPTVDRN